MRVTWRRSWLRIGMVTIALLFAIFFKTKALTEFLGSVLAVALWIAGMEYFFPQGISKASTAKKIFYGVMLLAIFAITVYLINTRRA